ncbi:sensor histidine kinase [Streptomyces sp. NPDC093600]|uniref:sensor histidine kinase n=1 Tax=Streptomyces sp. NPDC093600 TaxID=3366047 RepID=UPI003821FD85
MRTDTPDTAPPEPARPRSRAARAARLLVPARDTMQAFGLALATPTQPGAPLLAQARKRWLRQLPYGVAFAFVATLLPVTITVLVQDYQVNGALAGALATAQAAPLLLAVTRPLQAWWIIGTADIAGALLMLPADGLDGRPWPWTPMVVIGYLALMLALGLRESRRALLGVWLVTGAAGFLFELLSQRHTDGIHILLFVLSGVVLLITATLRERGDAERRTAEERARTTLLEERARIARELHDIVAHHMSVITVQADSAPYRIPDLPEAAREEFTSIAASARESLTEMRRLLVVLRNEGTEGERAPQPGLDRVQQLIEATVRAGVPAELSMAADLRDLGAVPQAVDLSAYRIVQEALANVVRHAPGARTRVSVRVEDGWLDVLVVNAPVPGRTSPLEGGTGTGHGLVGMRERVRLTGGTLDTGPLPDGGFRVAARLPLRTEDERP